MTVSGDTSTALYQTLILIHLVSSSPFILLQPPPLLSVIRLDKQGVCFYSSAENGRLLLLLFLQHARRVIILGREGCVDVWQSSSSRQPSGDRFTRAAISSAYDKLN